MQEKTRPPFAHNARLNAYLLGDRTCAAALGRQQHYLRPLHVALRRAWGSAAGLKHFAYLPRPRLQKAWSSQVKIIVHSPAAHSGADLIDCGRHRAHVSRRLDKASAGQDMIQPGPGSRSPSQKRTLPVQRSIRRAVGASPVQWFVSVIAAAINAPATTSVTCCRFMPSLRPPRSAHEMGAGAAHSPYRCSVFSAAPAKSPRAASRQMRHCDELLRSHRC
jgi:hypothetical protein